MQRPLTLSILLLFAAGATACAQQPAAPGGPAPGRAPGTVVGDRPANLQPTRDVAVTYRVTGTEQGEMRIRYSAAADAMRTDFTGFGPPGPVIADIRGRQMVMLVAAERTARVHPLDEPELSTFRQPEPGTRFDRQGARTVAGQRCTLWRVGPPVAGSAPPVTVCLAEDGTMLLTEDSAQRAEAVQVTYAPQDPALFRVPQGWQVQRE